MSRQLTTGYWLLVTDLRRLVAGRRLRVDRVIVGGLRLEA